MDGFEAVIESRCDKGGHVARIAQHFSRAADHRPAAPLIVPSSGIGR